MCAYGVKNVKYVALALGRGFFGPMPLRSNSKTPVNFPCIPLVDKGWEGPFLGETLEGTH